MVVRFVNQMCFMFNFLLHIIVTV